MLRSADAGRARLRLSVKRANLVRTIVTAGIIRIGKTLWRRRGGNHSPNSRAGGTARISGSSRAKRYAARRSTLRGPLGRPPDS